MSIFLTSFGDPSHGQSTERGEETDDDALALDQHKVAHDGGDASLPVVHVAQVGCCAHPSSVRVTDRWSRRIYQNYPTPLLVDYYHGSIVSSLLLYDNCWLLTVCFQLSVVYSQLQTVNCRLLTVSSWL